jgi:ER membrane protein complex subunit 1, C-terminal
MATVGGAVYDVSRHVLDPRRPNMNTPMEMREPGLPPYIPDLQFPPEVVLNYNQSVAVPRGIMCVFPFLTLDKFKLGYFCAGAVKC